jgi:GNAT superfamily N-acetyltransferase
MASELTSELASGLTGVERSLIRDALLRDAAANAYALADLQPRYAPHCRWFVQRAAGEVAVALLYVGLEPPIFMATGPPALIASALRQAELPPSLYMSVSAEVFGVLQDYYDFGDDVRPMWRMALDAEYSGPGDVANAPAWPDGRRLVQLRAEDASRLTALYAHGGAFAPDTFDAYQLDDGAFFGVEDASGALLAAGGTHIVDVTGGVAAIGNMYTHPQWRGQGLARTVLAAIVAALRGLCSKRRQQQEEQEEQGLPLIVLNVDQRNHTAAHLYRQYGFRVHCEFLEGIGVRRSRDG